MSEHDRLGRIEGHLGQVEGRLGQVEGRLGQVEGRLGQVEGRLGRIETDVTDIKTTLGQLMPMLVRLDQRLSDMPPAAEFYELRGRVEELSRRVPIAVGVYQPPGRPAAE